VEEVTRIVAQVRERWPDVKIILRADSGFCREELMTWCESNKVGYAIGLPRNPRLRGLIDEPMQQAQALRESTHKPARIFAGFEYRTLESWTRARRVVAKCEYLDKGENPRFVVTSLTREDKSDQALYEDFYCARGEMENRIKEFAAANACSPTGCLQKR